MRKLIAAVFLFLLGYAGSATSNELLHKDIIEGLDSTYQQVSPIQSADGKYHGFVAVDKAGSTVCVYDSSETVTNVLAVDDSLLTAIAFLSDDMDNLAVYALADLGNPWAFYLPDSNLFRLTKFTITNSAVESTSTRPLCYSSDGKILSLTGSLNFRFDNDMNIVAVVFKDVMQTSLWEATMGVTIKDHLTFIEYDLNLDSVIVRESANNLAMGNFGGEDECGIVKATRSYTYIDDPPYDIYTDAYARLSISNCSSLLASRYSDNGYVPYLFVGDFLDHLANDEIICGGNSYDLLGIREGRTNHWACYAINGTTISEVWWIPSPSGFEPYFYYKQKNAIVGITNGLSVDMLNTEVGLNTGSILLEHSMNFKTFLMAPGSELPSLFGTLGDTIYVYRMDVALDADDGPVEQLPSTFSLEQNYPNPFNPATTIEFSIPARSQVTVSIYNVLGQKLATIVDKELSAGRHFIQWSGTTDDGTSVASGIYFYKLQTDRQTSTRKMLLLK